MAFVIAEIGVNHGGNVREAVRLIGVAARVGADAVKFQAYNPELLDPPGSMRDMIRPLCLSHGDLEGLKISAEAYGIEFMATPFDPDTLEWLVGLGVKRLKISSGGLRDEYLLKAASTSGLPIILSTGMARHGDIWCALRTLKWAGNVTLLQCTSTYPCPPEDVNLRAMETLRREFGCQVGLSDHTTSIAIPAAAVALGATVIEKHLTASRDQVGPDHKASLEPNEFASMVEGIREVEKAMGDGIKCPQESEAPVMAVRGDREAWRCAS